MVRDQSAKGNIRRIPRQLIPRIYSRRISFCLFIRRLLVMLHSTYIVVSWTHKFYYSPAVMLIGDVFHEEKNESRSLWVWSIKKIVLICVIIFYTFSFLFIARRSRKKYNRYKSSFIRIQYFIICIYLALFVFISRCIFSLSVLIFTKIWAICEITVVGLITA